MITEIIDEETVAVAIDLGFGIVVNQKIKLAGIGYEKDAAKVQALKDKLSADLLQKELSMKSLKAEKSGRYLAFFYLDGHQESYNDELIKAGVARAFIKKPIKE